MTQVCVTASVCLTSANKREKGFVQNENVCIWFEFVSTSHSKMKVKALSNPQHKYGAFAVAASQFKPPCGLQIAFVVKQQHAEVFSLPGK